MSSIGKMLITISEFTKGRGPSMNPANRETPRALPIQVFADLSRGGEELGFRYKLDYRYQPGRVGHLFTRRCLDPVRAPPSGDHERTSVRVHWGKPGRPTA